VDTLYTIMVVLTILTANTPTITGCPLLVGPTVINRTQIEFYCKVQTNETDPKALYKVFFLFDSEVDAGVPFQILSFGKLTATLHERYLAGRLNKVVRFGSVYKLCTVCNTQFIVML